MRVVKPLNAAFLSSKLTRKFIVMRLNTIAEVIELLTAAVNLFLLLIANFKINELKRLDVMASITPEQIRKRKQIKLVMAEIEKIAQPDRLLLGRFRNTILWGEEHLTRMTITDEIRSSDEIESLKNKYQDVDASNIYDELENFSPNDFTLTDRDDPLLSISCVKHMDVDQIKVKASRLIVDKNKRIVAILELHYVNSYSNVFASPTQKRKIDILFNRLSGLLLPRR